MDLRTRQTRQRAVPNYVDLGQLQHWGVAVGDAKTAIRSGGGAADIPVHMRLGHSHRRAVRDHSGAAAGGLDGADGEEGVMSRPEVRAQPSDQWA